MKNIVNNVDYLFRTLESLTSIIEEPGVELAINTEVHEFLLQEYENAAGSPFPTESYPLMNPEDVSFMMLSNLILDWTYALNWSLLSEENPEMYSKMGVVTEAIQMVSEQMILFPAKEEPKEPRISSSKAVSKPNKEPSKAQLKAAEKKQAKNHKIVEDFLNGDWITSLLVMKEGEIRNSDRTKKETFGEYDIEASTATCILSEKNTYAPRSVAINEWLARQIKNYADYLRSSSSGSTDEDVALDFMSDLLTGFENRKSNSTEKDWAAGITVSVTLTGENLPGVALRVYPVQFTEAELEAMATQIDTLNQMAKKAKGFGVTPDSILYAEDIKVKLKSKSIKFENPIKSNEYDLSLVNIDRPAIDLVKQIQGVMSKPVSERPALVSCLFYGVPGSGKSQLANYIGQELNRKVLKKTYAELQSMYVGEGEKQLADAFAEARSENAILLIDELDSVAGSRDKAEKNYQKTFVNQLLTELDDFKGIFMATSNHMNGLDPAVLRRLFLKLKFDFLNEEQVQRCFELYFPKLAKRGKIGPMSYLTPGDFKAVREASLFDVKKVTVPRVRELLTQEVSLKKKTLSEVITSEKVTGYNF